MAKYKLEHSLIGFGDDANFAVWNGEGNHLPPARGHFEACSGVERIQSCHRHAYSISAPVEMAA